MSAASRRGFLAALAAVTGTGRPVAVAATVEATPPADAALILADARYRHAAELRDIGRAHLSEARAAAAVFLGPCPPVLVIDWRRDRLPNHGRRRENPLGFVSRFAGGDDGHRARWTGPAVRDTIASLSGGLGRAGTTPFLIRHLRRLLPVADARDAREAEADRRFNVERLGDALGELDRALRRAAAAVVEAPAETPRGAAIKARLALDIHERREDRIHLAAEIRAALEAAAAVGEAA